MCVHAPPPSAWPTHMHMHTHLQHLVHMNTHTHTCHCAVSHLARILSTQNVTKGPQVCVNLSGGVRGRGRAEWGLCVVWLGLEALVVGALAAPHARQQFKLVVVSCAHTHTCTRTRTRTRAHTHTRTHTRTRTRTRTHTHTRTRTHLGNGGHTNENGRLERLHS